MINSISVKHKIWLIIAIALIGSASILTYELINVRQQLMDSRKQELSHLVENVDSLIKSHHAKLGASQETEEQVQQQVLSLLTTLRYDNGAGYFWINNLQAAVVLHPIKPQLNGQDLSNFKDPKGTRVFHEFVKVAKQSGHGYVDYFWEKPGETLASPKLSFVKLFEPWGWVIGTGVYVDDIDRLFWKNLISSLSLFGLAVAIIILVASSIARSIVSPLNDIVSGMAKISRGDLTVTFNIDERQDELGTLAQSAHSMLCAFKKLVGNITDSSNQLLDSAQQLSDSSERTSSGSSHQLQQTAVVAVSIEEVASTAQEVARNTQEAAAATESVDSATQAGNRQMTETIDTIGAMSDGIKDTSAAIKKLEQDTEQIDDVLDVIRGVSEQTNLLALNAAIEAARAGESGRGFAVVADEVRTLAQRTHKSTEEIKEMTELLQSAAQNAVLAMVAGQAQAESALALATATGQTMMEISQQVSVLNNMNISIASTAEEQGAVALELNKNIANIRNIAEETASTMLSNSKSSYELQQIAQKMDSQLGSFHL